MNRGYPQDLLKETTKDLMFEDRARYLEERDSKTLEECTTLLRVKQHPVISSAAIYRALDDRELPFINKVVKTRPTTIGELITRASSSAVRSDYALRSNNRDTKEERHIHRSPPEGRPLKQLSKQLSTPTFDFTW